MFNSFEDHIPRTGQSSDFTDLKGILTGDPGKDVTGISLDLMACIFLVMKTSIRP